MPKKLPKLHYHTKMMSPTEIRASGETIELAVPVVNLLYEQRSLNRVAFFLEIDHTEWQDVRNYEKYYIRTVPWEEDEKRDRTTTIHEYYELREKYGEKLRVESGASFAHDMCVCGEISLNDRLDEYLESYKKYKKPSRNEFYQLGKAYVEERLRMLISMGGADGGLDRMFFTTLPVAPIDEMKGQYAHIRKLNEELQFLLEHEAPSMLVHHQVSQLQRAVDSVMNQLMKMHGTDFMKALPSLTPGRFGRSSLPVSPSKMMPIFYGLGIELRECSSGCEADVLKGGVPDAGVGESESV